jgi:hypothetical protein
MEKSNLTKHKYREWYKGPEKREEFLGEIEADIEKKRATPFSRVFFRQRY